MLRSWARSHPKLLAASLHHAVLQTPVSASAFSTVQTCCPVAHLEEVVTAGWYTSVGCWRCSSDLLGGTGWDTGDWAAAPQRCQSCKPLFSKALKGDREQCCSITRYLCFLLYEQDVRTGESGSVLKCSTEITKNSKYIFEFLKACEEWHSTGVMHIQSVQALACWQPWVLKL